MAMELVQSIKEEPVAMVAPDNDDDEEMNDDRPVRRPMNAFLLFCKRHRTLVKERHPWLDNRSATKMLADMWAVLDTHEKEKYLELARQCKAAFLKAYPDYKWCGTTKTQTSTPTSPTVTTRKMHADSNNDDKEGRDASITPGKLADPADMGGLNLLLMAGEQALTPNNNNNNNSDDDNTNKVSPSSSRSSSMDLVTDSPSNTVRKRSTDPITDPVTDPVTDPADDKSDSSRQSALLQFAQMCSEQPSFQQKKSTSQQKAKHSSANESQATSVNQLQSANESTESERTEKKKKKVKKHKGDKDKDINAPEKKKKKSQKGECKKEMSDEMSEKTTKKRKKHGEEKKKKKKLKKVPKRKEEEEEREGSTSSCMTELEKDDEINNDSEQDIDEDADAHCRKSSRSCKGKLYKQFVSGGMLHDLQRPERPFNCKRPWKADFVSYSDEDDPTVDMETKAVKRRRASLSRRRRASESNIGKDKSDGPGRGADRRSVDVLDYADFDFKAKLDSLPQFTLDQFKPKSRSQTKKKCTNMYKNAVFVKKEGHDDFEHHKDYTNLNLDEDSYSKPSGVKITRIKSVPSVTGSRKRKARKRSITHIIRTKSDDGESKVTISTQSKKLAAMQRDQGVKSEQELPKLSKSTPTLGRSLPV